MYFWEIEQPPPVYLPSTAGKHFLKSSFFSDTMCCLSWGKDFNKEVFPTTSKHQQISTFYYEFWHKTTTLWPINTRNFKGSLQAL